MMALVQKMAARGRPAWVCAVGVLVMACGGGDESTPTSSAAVVAERESAAAVTGADRSSKRKNPRSRNWRGITAMDIAPDGSVALAGADGSVQLEPVAGNGRTTMAEASGVAATAVAFTADGKHLVGVSRDSVARVWGLGARDRPVTLHGHEHPLRTVAVSADGAFLASAGEETRVLLWTASTGKLAKILNGHTSFVNAVAFSQDGRMLASGDASGKVMIWNLANGVPRHRPLEHADEINSVAFSPDGRVLAAAGEDGRVTLWNTDNGLKLQVLEGHRAPVRTVAFSRDGQWLASGGEDARVLVWDAVSRTLSRTLANGGGAAVNTVVFDLAKRKQVLFVGDEDGRMSRWDVALGEPR